MGCFSWITSDTEERIIMDNPRTVYLLQPDGLPPIAEKCYEGYGVFGGVDAYDWLADINGVPRGDGERRGDGIDLAFSGKEIKYPLKFSYNPDAIYEELEPSESDPDQGFPDYEDDDNYCAVCGGPI